MSIVPLSHVSPEQLRELWGDQPRQGPPATSAWESSLRRLWVRTPLWQDEVTVSVHWGEDVGLFDTLHLGSLQNSISGLRFEGVPQVLAQDPALAGWREQGGPLPLRQILEGFRNHYLPQPAPWRLVSWLTLAFLWVGKEEFAGSPPIVAADVLREAYATVTAKA